MRGQSKSGYLYLPAAEGNNNNNNNNSHPGRQAWPIKSCYCDKCARACTAIYLSSPQYKYHQTFFQIFPAYDYGTVLELHHAWELKTIYLFIMHACMGNTDGNEQLIRAYERSLLLLASELCHGQVMNLLLYSTTVMDRYYHPSWVTYIWWIF